MTIDELGRAAAVEARAGAEAAVDTSAMLHRMHRLHRMRRRRAAGSIVAVLAAAVVVGSLLISHNARTDSHPSPATTPTPKATGICANPEVRCLDATKFRFVDLPVTITLTLPANFERDFSLAPNTVDGYRNDIGTTGVSVQEHARPVKYGPVLWTRDPTAGTTAASMARWLSKRPYLVHTTLTRTAVGGRPAWHVTGDLKRGVALPAAKAGGNVAPTFGGGRLGGGAGYRPGLTGQYTLLDVPGAGVTVIWSWTMNHGKQALAGNQAFIDGLSFG
jgi:hypothetical protein